jgi:hypothetical protein
MMLAMMMVVEGMKQAWLGSSLAKILEQRAIKNRVQYIHYR